MAEPIGPTAVACCDPPLTRFRQCRLEADEGVVGGVSIAVRLSLSEPPPPLVLNPTEAPPVFPFILALAQAPATGESGWSASKPGRFNMTAARRR